MSRTFAQRLSSTLMIPIIIIPIAALFQGLAFILGMPVLAEAGRALLVQFLPLVFAVAVVIGFADGEPMAILSAVVGYAVMVRVAGMIVGDATMVLPGVAQPVAIGRENLNVGALGGMISGALAVWLWHRCRHVRLPEVLTLFSGPRFVPSVVAVAAVPLGIAIGLAWPEVMRGIAAVGSWAVAAGAAGAFVYGAVLRVLVPTGLHHIINNLVEYQLGAYADPNTGTVVTGEIQRFLHGDQQAGLLMSGFYVLMNFCIPAIALALAHSARPGQRRRVGGLMTTGALTSVVVGVTEPVEFAFVYSAPVLWVFHALMQGAVSAAAYALGIRHWGYALPLYVINYGASTKAWLIIPLGLAFGLIYYVVFRLALATFHWPVLGQQEEAGAAAPTAGNDGAGAVLQALGGAGNIRSLSACMSRLRLEVVQPAEVDDPALARLGASGVVRLGSGLVQVVFGVRSQALCDQLRFLVAGSAATRKASGSDAAPVPDTAATDGVVVLVAPLSGDVVPLGQVPDPVFSTGLAGDGVAILPAFGRMVAPCVGRVAHVFPGGHAIGLVAAGGLEILLHVGIDTVSLQGRGFHPAVREGDEVSAGQELLLFDPSEIHAAGRSLLTPVLITNPDQVERLEFLPVTAAVAGETPILRITVRKS